MDMETDNWNHCFGDGNVNGCGDGEGDGNGCGDGHGTNDGYGYRYINGIIFGYSDGYETSDNKLNVHGNGYV